MDVPESRVATTQVELHGARRFDLFLNEAEPLSWAEHVTVELESETGLIMITVMGLTFRLLKLPNDATNLLEKCVTCNRTVTWVRWQGMYRHLSSYGILPRKCYPDDPASVAVATPRRLAGMVLVDVPTEETSTVPLVETHAGQYVLMPARPLHSV
jgi:hypothetical protein